MEQVPDSSSLLFSGSNHSDNDKTVIGREFSKVLEACLQRLPDHYRTTFTLKELTGLSIAETAEVMHTTTSNVKVRLNRAKAQLRKEMEGFYTPEDIFEFNLVYCDRIVNSVMSVIKKLENHPNKT